MSGVFKHFAAVLVLIGAIGMSGSTAKANWLETFDGNSFSLATWQFACYPDLTKTFNATIRDGLDDNDYISLDETSPADVGGSQFGVGIGDPGDIFRDVRVGALFNVTGDASWNYHGLVARADYFIDDGSITGVPGISTFRPTLWRPGNRRFRCPVWITPKATILSWMLSDQIPYTLRVVFMSMKAVPCS